eukprot:7034993-Lingulodinium_polyedra.AAC.1
MHDPLLWAVYEDPRLGHRHPRDVPDPLPRVQVCAARAELLALLHKWDHVGALRLVPACDSDPAFRCGLFATPKDE